MNELIPSPQDITTLEKIGEYAIKSGFLPSSIKTAQQAVIIALKGKELGIPPMQAFSQIVVVQGKPTISAELMLALVYKNCPDAEIVFSKSDNMGCEIKARRKEAHQYATFSFTSEDAKRANLLGKDSWNKYPAAMFRARCISAMCRAMFPDAIAGASYTEEELETNDSKNTAVSSSKPISLSNDVSQEIVKSSKTHTIEPSGALSNVIDAEPIEVKNLASKEEIEKLKIRLFNRMGMSTDEAKAFVQKHIGKDTLKGISKDDVTVLLFKSDEILNANPQNDLDLRK